MLAQNIPAPTFTTATPPLSVQAVSLPPSVSAAPLRFSMLSSPRGATGKSLHSTPKKTVG